MEDIKVMVTCNDHSLSRLIETVETIDNAHIIDITKHLYNEAVPAVSQRMEMRIQIQKLLRSLGITAGLNGYRCLISAVEYVLKYPKCLITKELYADIAAHENMSQANVERAIRHAIEKAWTLGDQEAISSIVGCRGNKPTNAEFIFSIAETLKEQ